MDKQKDDGIMRSPQPLVNQRRYEDSTVNLRHKKTGQSQSLILMPFHLASPKTKSTSSFMSGCITLLASFAGIGMEPQWPEPPWETFIINPSTRGYSLPLYSNLSTLLYFKETFINA